MEENKLNLFLIRHGKSDWKQNLPDYDRPLNERGKRDAPIIGEFLSKSGVKPDLIIASSAARTRATAILLSQKLGYSADKIMFLDELYLASYKTIVNTLSDSGDNAETIIIVGHNPGISNSVEYLSSDFLELKTCCVAHLVPQVDDWQALGSDTCVLLNHISPKALIQ